MKQLLQNMRSGETTVEDIPVPVPKQGTALVRVSASLVSAGTERMLVEFAERSLAGKARSRPDLMRQVLDRARREGLLSTVQAAFNRLDQPLALGYSSAGVITALGKDMPGFRVGQRVACAGGGYAVHAEYNVVPRNLLARLPDSVDFESAAFATLGAIALHGFRLGEAQVGENVAVVGLGLLGLLAGQIASASGCRVLGIDVNPERVGLAASLGLQSVVRPQAEEASAAFTSRGGFDLVLICADTSSDDPVKLAGSIARDRGRVVATGAVGLQIPRKPYYEKELSFINSRSYGPGRYDPAYEEGGRDYPPGYVRWTEGRNLEAVVSLLADGRIDVKPLITHRFPIERAPEAYAIITGKKKEAFLGVLLTYPESPQAPADTRITFRTTIQPSVDVRLGVLGAGLFAGATLLPVLKRMEGLSLVGIASAGGLNAQHAARKFGFNYACSAEDDLIDDPDINTVAILTRHDRHAELVIKSLKAGKHVFVEKPLALSREQLSRVGKVLKKETGVLLAVGFNRRFAPLSVRLKDFLEPRREPLFAHYRVNAGFVPLNHWTQDPVQGGGRLIGEACHFVDMLTFLVGEPPSRVSAHGLPDGGRYREDNLSLTFTFTDGSLGVVDYLANGDRSLPKERLEVFCGGRVAVLDDFRSLVLVRDGRRRVWKPAGRQDKGHRAEWQSFVGAIRAGGEPPIPYAQLIGVTGATFAALDSLRGGGEGVEV